MIRLLHTRRGESRGGRRRKRQRVLSEHQKLVDALLRSLHNLVSLLLTQQRKTGGTGGWLNPVRGVERRDL